VTNERLRIQYREFYDVPRMVVVEYRGGRYLFDSQFDQERDEYPDEYIVYLLAPEVPADIKGISWEDLASKGEPIGTVPISSMEFDPTRRVTISARALESLGR